MSDHGLFAETLTKLAAEQEKRKRNAFLSSLPFVVGGAAAEFPKGVVEEGIDRGIRSGPRAALQGGKAALRRGVGRLGGELGAASITTPLFLKGIKDIREGKTRKGTAEVVAAGTGFSAIKGGIEAAGMGAGGKKALLKNIKNLAGSRAITGAGAAAVTANAIGRSLRAPKNKKEANKQRYLLPAITGAAVGAPRGAFEEVWKLKGDNKLKALRTRAGKRGVLAKATGRAAAGAIGTLAAAELARKVLRPRGKTREKTKVSSSEISVPTATDVYDRSRGEARGLQTSDLHQLERKLLGLGERNQVDRAALYAVQDELQDRGQQVKATKTRTRLLVERSEAPSALAALGVSVAPEVLFGLGALIPKNQREHLAREGIEKAIVAEGIERTYGGPAHFRMGLDGRRTIHAGIKAESGILAHELGHARAGAFRRKVLQNAPVQAAGNVGALGGALATAATLASLGDRSFLTKEELESRAGILNRIGVVAGAMQAPRLAEEAIATAKGMTYVAKHGGSLRRYAARLLPAFGTYAVPAVLPFAAAAMMNRAASKAKEQT